MIEHDDEQAEADSPLTPAEMLALGQQQQRRVAAVFTRPVALLLLIWAIAWGLGFTALWLGQTSELLSPLVSGVIFAVLIASAAIASAVIGPRINHGIRTRNAFAGAVYGYMWVFGSLAVGGLGAILLAQGMPDELAMVYFPAAFSILAGLLYAAGAAIWNSISQLVIGAWILLVGMIAAVLGAPVNLLLMATLGGGGLLVAAIVVWQGSRVRNG